MLADPARCQVMLVTTPEETPVSETIETAELLEDGAGVRLCGVVVNAKFPVLSLPTPMGAGELSERAAAAGVVLTEEEAQSLAAAAQLRVQRQESQAAQVARLAAELPLPQLELPFCFSAELGPDQLEALTDARRRRRSRAGRRCRRERQKDLPPARRPNTSWGRGARGRRAGSRRGRRSRARRSRARRSRARRPGGRRPGGRRPGGRPPESRRSGGRRPRGRRGGSCGSGRRVRRAGGVGKTTAAAASGPRGARLGLRSCVVTIDPARRLADALGISDVGNEPHQVPAPAGGDPGPGSCGR